jgi:hypothetical protein
VKEQSEYAKRGYAKMENRQIEYALRIAENLYKNGKISKMQWWEIEGGFYDIRGGFITRGLEFLLSLEKETQKIAFEILKTVGVGA